MAKVDAKGRLKLKKFGRILRKIREDRGWSLEDAEGHGFRSWRVLQRLESGKHNVSLLTLIEIGKIYRMSASEVIAGL